MTANGCATSERCTRSSVVGPEVVASGSSRYTEERAGPAAEWAAAFVEASPTIR